MDDMKKYSEMDGLSDHDLDCIMDMMVEVDKLRANSAIMKMVEERAAKKTKEINSITDLKEAGKAEVEKPPKGAPKNLKELKDMAKKKNLPEEEDSGEEKEDSDAEMGDEKPIVSVHIFGK